MTTKDNCKLCNNLDIQEPIEMDQLCEECLDDIFTCKYCGINQPYCNECV